MKKVEDADVFITNGLGMENFLEKVINANANMKIIDSSKNIENTISHKEETNAHIWTNTEKYIQQIQNIKDGLQETSRACLKDFPPLCPLSPTTNFSISNF